MEDEFASFLAEIETLETKAKKTETNEDETRPAKKKNVSKTKKCTYSSSTSKKPKLKKSGGKKGNLEETKDRQENGSYNKKRKREGESNGVPRKTSDVKKSARVVVSAPPSRTSKVTPKRLQTGERYHSSSSSSSSSQEVLPHSYKSDGHRVSDGGGGSRPGFNVSTSFHQRTHGHPPRPPPPTRGNITGEAFMPTGNAAVPPPPPLPLEVSKHDTAKRKTHFRSAAGHVWEDRSLADWPEGDFRIFVGNLGNEVTTEMLGDVFAKSGEFKSFAMAKVMRDKRTKKSRGYGFVSFLHPNDMVKALKEMNGKYCGNRPMKLSKSTWNKRSVGNKRGRRMKKKRHLSIF